MASANGRYVIVYNGGLYDYRELAAELADSGHSFASRTDTEVVLHAYQEWGPDCLHRFNGMFAFAVWDTRTRELFVARDRLGIKPLYYVTIGGTFAFGSEVKALIAAGYRAQVSPAGLAEYFTFQNTLSDATLFDGVRMLYGGASSGSAEVAPRPDRPSTGTSPSNRTSQSRLRSGSRASAPPSEGCDASARKRCSDR